MKFLPGKPHLSSTQLLLFMVFFLFSTPGLHAQVTAVSSGVAATITSDQEDYAPRSNAVFTGANFSPGETVLLKVKNLNSPCNTVSPDSSYLPWSVTAGADGGFVTNWTVCNCPGDSLRLKAAGQISGQVAYAYFTDAAQVGDIIIGNQIGTAIYGIPNSVTFSLTIVRDGNGGGGFTTNLTASGLPTGASISPPSVTFGGNDKSITTPLTVTSVATTPAGNYQSFRITASGISPNPPNPKNSNLTTYSIDKSEQSITWSNPADIVYGTALSATQLNASTSGGAGLTYSPALGTVLNAGTHILKVTAGATSNFKEGTRDVTITVLPKPITITASDQSKTYGAALLLGTTAFTLNASTPMVASESIASVTLMSVGAAAGAAAGDYAIVPSGAISGSNTSLSNYAITYTSGTLTVSKAPTTISITINNTTYDGNTHGGTASVIGTGGLNQAVVIQYEGTGSTNYPSTTTPPTNAGTYNATATYAGSANHFGSSDSKSFTIAKAPTTTVVTIQGGPFTYTGSAQTPVTVSVTGPGNLSLTPAADYVGNTNAGTAKARYYYAGDNNYLASSDSMTFNIGKAASTTTVAITGGPFTYTGLAQTPATVSVTGAGGLSISPAAVYTDNIEAGTATASYSYAGSPNHFGSTDSKTFLIEKAILTVTADNVGDNATRIQYSDLVPAFTATITGFKNGQTLTTSGVAGYPSFATDALIINGKVESPSGTYKITPSLGSLTASNYDFNTASFVKGDLIVEKEDAEIVYSGLEYFTTDGATSNTAKVEFMASLKDADDGAATRGDISRAVVDFSVPGGLTLAAPTTSTPGTLTQRAVGLADPADQTVGLARTELMKVLLSNAEMKDGGKIVELNAEVRISPTNNFYTGSMAPKTGGITANSEKKLITIAMPGQDFVSGGGHVIATNPAGTYAAELNTRVKFGFTMKWNKSGKNIQGQTTVIFRKMVGNELRTFQIKSNAINTLGTANVTGGRRADFNTKATLRDVTDELNPITISGNLDLTMQAFESTNPAVLSEIGITLRSGSVLLFSCHWDNNTSARKGLGKGAIRILNASTPTATTARVAAPTSTLQPEFKAQFESYPNPFSNATAFRFALETEQEYELAIYDTRGMLIKRVDTGRAEAGKLYEMKLDGKYLAPGIYFARLVTNDGVKLLRVVKQ